LSTTTVTTTSTHYSGKTVIALQVHEFPVVRALVIQARCGHISKPLWQKLI